MFMKDRVHPPINRRGVEFQCRIRDLQPFALQGATTECLSKRSSTLFLIENQDVVRLWNWL